MVTTTERNCANTMDGDAVAQIRQLEDQVFESKKHLNNVVAILEYAKNDDPKTVYSSIHALLRIYTPFIKDGTIRENVIQDSQAEVAPAKAKVDHWVRKKYSQFHATLNGLLRHDNVTLQVAAARICMQLVEKESMASSELSGSYRFAHGTYRRVLRTMLSTPQLSDELCHLLVNSYLNTYDDLRYHFFEIATQLMAPTEETNDTVGSKRGQKEPKHVDTSVQDIALNVFRVLDVLHNLPMPESKMTEFWAVNPNDYTLARPSKKARTQGDATPSRSAERCTVPHEHCVQFENCWLALLKQPLTLEMYKHILLKLHKRVIPHMAHPPSLLNFLVHIYDQGGVISVLALNSLFTLIQHHNLNYPDFYTKLYSLFDRNIFHVKYRSRFCRLTIKFLSSTKLSAHLIAAFIKRMARLALFAPPAALTTMIPLVFNLLKMHPSCMVMLHREAENVHGVILRPYEYDDSDSETETKADITNKSPSSSVGSADDSTAKPQWNDWLAADCFDPFTSDPMASQAIESSLWELKALQSHYLPQVATLARVFAQKFTQPSFDMEDFLDHTYSTIVAAELNVPLTKPPSLAATGPTLLFAPGDGFYDVWDLES